MIFRIALVNGRCSRRTFRREYPAGAIATAMSTHVHLYTSRSDEINGFRPEVSSSSREALRKRCLPSSTKASIMWWWSKPEIGGVKKLKHKCRRQHELLTASGCIHLSCSLPLAPPLLSLCALPAPAMALGLGLAGPHYHFSWPCSFQALLRLLFLFQLFVRLTLNRLVGYFNAVV